MSTLLFEDQFWLGLVKVVYVSSTPAAVTEGRRIFESLLFTVLEDDGTYKPTAVNGSSLDTYYLYGFYACKMTIYNIVVRRRLLRCSLHNL